MQHIPVLVRKLMFCPCPIDYMEGKVDELLKERQRKLDRATEERINIGRLRKRLHKYKIFNMLEVPGKAKTGSAGEQPVRNIPTCWNNLMVEKYSTNEILLLFRSFMPKKTQICFFGLHYILNGYKYDTDLSKTYY